MHYYAYVNIDQWQNALMSDFRKTLAQNLRAMRGRETQSTFARRAGMNQASINRIEQGQQNVTLDTLEKLCKRFKCSVSDLLEKNK